MGWHFRELTVGEKTREPIQGEFFSTDAIRNHADALVRESIQNSLDAAIKGADGKPADTIRVRLLIAQGPHALPAHRVATYFDGAWAHFAAEGNGLRDIPSESETCPFLLFEEFGTTGLRGDFTQAFEDPKKDNPFFYFFRAEGRSGKGELDRGRWGIGKFVFPRCSRLHSLFGLTVRDNDGKRLLMGQSVLKTHRINGKHYSPDAFFGQLHESGLIVPLEDQTFLDQFSQDFGLSRKNESGLSIVVPWIDEDEMTFESLVEAVLRDYFYPILSGSLVVTVERPGRLIEINAETLIETAREFGGDSADELLPFVELAEWAAFRPPQDFIQLEPADPDKPVWTEKLIPKDKLPAMRQALERGERLAIRASLTVREKGKPSRPASFAIFLRRDGNEDGRPKFIREGVLISDVRPHRARGIRSLVVIEDRPIATLLGDSENPAHTQWQKDSSNFKGKYFYGPSYLDFVTRSVSVLVGFLAEKDKEEDPTLLLDVFSLPSTEDEEPITPKPHPKTKDGPVPPPPPPPPPPRPSRFRVQKVTGGFSLVPGDQPLSQPITLEIRVAYDLRRGSPLKKYHPADFRLNQAPIRLDPVPVGMKVLGREDNRMRVQLEQPDFRLTVLGFDENRDLFVNARQEEGANDSQA